MQKLGKPLICLAASGGGHFRQLLDLKPLWSEYPHFFISEDTALARSLAKHEDVEFVPHFALGQSRLGKTAAMIRSALASVGQSFRIVWRKRPDVVITTGAGSQFFVLLAAKLVGAKVILIDSFARFTAPSKFARIAGPVANLRISQSHESAQHWPGALTFDPLRAAEVRNIAKEPLLFATVGAILPFDRLASMIVRLKQEGRLPEQVILQVGKGAAPLPSVPGITVLEELPFDEIHALLERASLVVSHGGTGSLITALSHECRVVAVPRRVDCGDSYDDHQMEIAENFRERGLIEVADDIDSLEAALARARLATPKPVKMDHSLLVGHLDRTIREYFSGEPMAGCPMPQVRP